MDDGFNTASGKCCCNIYIRNKQELFFVCFNTASGKCCCNSDAVAIRCYSIMVSIPQAVSAVATVEALYVYHLVDIDGFQYRKR